MLSPPGQGWDTYRTWETLALGRFPVLLHTHLDPIFADLPAVMVSKWTVVTPEFLEEQWQRLSGLKYVMDKLLMTWWEIFILKECMATL